MEEEVKKSKKKAEVVENKHGVPDKLWSSFKDKKHVFNSVMDVAIKDQSLYTHPNMPILGKEYWKTICWNFACMATWASLDIDVKTVKIEE